MYVPLVIFRTTAKYEREISVCVCFFLVSINIKSANIDQWNETKLAESVALWWFISLFFVCSFEFRCASKAVWVNCWFISFQLLQYTIHNSIWLRLNFNPIDYIDEMKINTILMGKRSIFWPLAIASIPLKPSNFVKEISFVSFSFAFDFSGRSRASTFSFNSMKKTCRENITVAG